MLTVTPTRRKGTVFSIIAWRTKQTADSNQHHRIMRPQTLAVIRACRTNISVLCYYFHFPVEIVAVLIRNVAARGHAPFYCIFIFPHTNYTFPYNYLVTTSFQLKTYLRRSLLSPTHNGRYPFDALTASLLSDRDGRFVQNSRTCSPQLGWFAITGDSIFTRLKLQSAIRTEKTFHYWPSIRSKIWHLHCSKCVAQLIKAITIWRHPRFHLTKWADLKEIYHSSASDIKASAIQNRIVHHTKSKT